MLWEVLFMLLILKLPVVYLCAVVWYAIRAEPDLATGEDGAAGDRSPAPWTPSAPSAGGDRKPDRGGPHGTPDRAYARTRRADPARAGVEPR